MRFAVLSKRFVRDYFIIFSAIVICLTVLRTILQPDATMTLTDIYILMVCALAGDLPGLILYSPRALSEKEMRIRLILHFILLEALILLLAVVTGWVSGWVNIAALVVEIALIYAFVRLLVWMEDRKVTDSINARLKVLNANPGEDAEE